MYKHSHVIFRAILTTNVHFTHFFRYFFSVGSSGYNDEEKKYILLRMRKVLFLTFAHKLFFNKNNCVYKYNYIVS